MPVALDQLYNTARTLPMSDMGILVARLLGDISKRLPESSDDEINALADEREEEMDRDPSIIVSHEEMLQFLASKRR